MRAQWLEDLLPRLTQWQAAGVERLAALATPRIATRLRWVLVLLAAFWILSSLSQLLWLLLAPAPVPSDASYKIINPIQAAVSTGGTTAVDVEALVAWHLFGKASDQDAAAAAVAAAEEAQRASADLAGIENNARETRLSLTLTGIVSADDDGLGYAIIEHQRQQAVYAVDDELPAGRGIKLAKVLSDRVVLDNRGTYELLILFDDGELSGMVAPTAAAGTRPVPRPVAPGQAAVVDKRQDPAATELAQTYRQRLYSDPQSLAEVVQISAVRSEDGLQGYRVRPGRDAAAFENLGFKADDLIKGINGITLDDPSKAMQLYQVMRSASEAVFLLERAGAEMELTVGLDDSA